MPGSARQSPGVLGRRDFPGNPDGGPPLLFSLLCLETGAVVSAGTSVGRRSAVRGTRDKGPAEGQVPGTELTMVPPGWRSWDSPRLPRWNWRDRQDRDTGAPVPLPEVPLRVCQRATFAAVNSSKLLGIPTPSRARFSQSVLMK